jgi:hypothetical protein
VVAVGKGKEGCISCVYVNVDASFSYMACFCTCLRLTIS